MTTSTCTVHRPPKTNLFVCLFVCLFGVYRPTREFFTHMETSPLPVKGCKFSSSYARHSWPSSSEGSLTWHTYCDMVLPFIMVSVQYMFLYTWVKRFFVYTCVPVQCSLNTGKRQNKSKRVTMESWDCLIKAFYYITMCF